MIRKLATVFGIIFVAIGILGFVPGVTTDHMLFGLFHVGVVHNIIHLLSGIVALIAMNSAGLSRLYFRIFGAIYALVAVIGWLQGTTVLGLFDVNLADNVLHTVLALVILAIGFALPDVEAPREVSAAQTE